MAPVASTTAAATATCNSNAVAFDLIPLNTFYEDRIQQLDLRLTRIFPLGRTKLRGNFDAYNVFNGSSILNEQTRYSAPNGGAWANAIQVMGGRVFKFSAQLEF